MEFEEGYKGKLKVISNSEKPLLWIMHLQADGVANNYAFQHNSGVSPSSLTNGSDSTISILVSKNCARGHSVKGE